MNRRAFIRQTASLMTGAAYLQGQRTLSPPPANTSSLKNAAQKSGRILGVFAGFHQLEFDPTAASIIASTFSMIADGNDLKFTNRLRPAPDTYDFVLGDYVVNWAARHGLLFRGHCLVWWNALPDWFQSYVAPSNARKVMTDHITTVVRRYAGKIYSWDVVNEPIYHDNRPDGLRRKPWLDLLGSEYINIAFQTAHEADPNARLVLNECYIEHNTAAETERRNQLLALATRLKRDGVPITSIGIQGHLRGNVPLDKLGMDKFLKQVRDLGLEILVTELDVDDVDVPGPLIDETVATKYGEFIDLVGPFAKAITLEGLSDEVGAPRTDGFAHRPNILDSSYRTKPAYDSAASSLSALNHSLAG